MKLIFRVAGEELSIKLSMKLVSFSRRLNTIHVLWAALFTPSPDHHHHTCSAAPHLAELVGQVTHTSRDLLSIAALTASLNVDGHRADLVILKAARAQAAFEGRTKINDHDIALAAELALPHRIKRTPFQQAEMTTEQLQERIEQLAGQSVPNEAESEESESQEGESKSEEKKT